MTEPRRQDGDVVDLLQRQHAMIRRLCDTVTGAPPAGRSEPFQQLLRLMAVHEAVEEEIVHPYVRRRLPDGNAMVTERLHEEHDAKRMLVALDALGPSGTGFAELFEQYRTALFTHIDREEASEFAGLREKTRPAERSAMAAAVKVASALAPTHPHPGVESAARNLLIGTPLAMIDRARDMIRHAMAPKPAAEVTGEAPAGGPPTAGPTAVDIGTQQPPTPVAGPTATDGGPTNEPSGGVYTPGAPGTTGATGGTAGGAPGTAGAPGGAAESGAGGAPESGAGGAPAGADSPPNDPTVGTVEPGASGRPIPPG